MNSGGAERVVANLSNAFSRSNIKVTILMISVTKPFSFYEIDQSVNLAVLSQNKIYKGLGKIRKLKDYFTTNQFDVVISFLPNPIIYSYFATKKIDTKLVCSERSNPKKYNFIKKAILRYVFKHADGAIFQTERAFNYYKCDFGTIIYNPIAFLPNLDICEHKKTISFIGSYRKVKNFKLLFKSFKHFLYTHSDFVLNIYGVDRNNNKCVKQIQKYNLTNSVCLKGKVSNVQKEILESSLFVSTSKYEGMSNSILEAVAMGIPCVATDCDIGGNSEISKYYTNLYLTNFKYTNFSKMMSKAVSNFSTPSIKEKFDLDYVSKKWLDYIALTIKK